MGILIYREDYRRLRCFGTGRKKWKKKNYNTFIFKSRARANIALFSPNTFLPISGRVCSDMVCRNVKQFYKSSNRRACGEHDLTPYPPSTQYLLRPATPISRTLFNRLLFTEHRSVDEDHSSEIVPVRPTTDVTGSWVQMSRIPGSLTAPRSYLPMTGGEG